LELVNVVMM